jgi:hypothetical protein
MRARQVTHRLNVRSAAPLIDSSMAGAAALSRLGSGNGGGVAGTVTKRHGLQFNGLGLHNTRLRPKKSPRTKRPLAAMWVHDRILGFTKPFPPVSCYKVLASHTLAPPPHQLLFVLPQPPFKRSRYIRRHLLRRILCNLSLDLLFLFTDRSHRACYRFLGVF